MLHKERVARAVYYAMRRRIRNALGFRPRKTAAPILFYGMDAAIERHGWIVKSLLKHMPEEIDLRGKAACEVGAGDCLAAASVFLKKGASKVNIVEIEPPAVNQSQLDVLKALSAQGLPIDLSIVRGDGDLKLDASRVAYHLCFMEDFKSEEQHEFLFSFSVMEHVEDLDRFYACCNRVMSPGARMLHLIDLGGHEMFEDPIPPLDFQTYSDGLFNFMYPKYHRATRRFLDEHVEAVKKSGFRVVKVTPTRKADEKYLRNLWPQLRPAAQKRPFEEVQVVEFALLAQKQ